MSCLSRHVGCCKCKGYPYETITCQVWSGTRLGEKKKGERKKNTWSASSSQARASKRRCPLRWPSSCRGKDTAILTLHNNVSSVGYPRRSPTKKKKKGSKATSAMESAKQSTAAARPRPPRASDPCPVCRTNVHCGEKDNQRTQVRSSQGEQARPRWRESTVLHEKPATSTR